MNSIIESQITLYECTFRNIVEDKVEKLIEESRIECCSKSDSSETLKKILQIERDKIVRDKLNIMKQGSLPVWCGFRITKEEYEEGMQYINNWDVKGSEVLKKQKKYALDIFSMRKPPM